MMMSQDLKIRWMIINVFDYEVTGCKLLPPPLPKLPPVFTPAPTIRGSFTGPLVVLGFLFILTGIVMTASFYRSTINQPRRFISTFDHSTHNDFEYDYDYAQGRFLPLPVSSLQLTSICPLLWLGLIPGQTVDSAQLSISYKQIEIICSMLGRAHKRYYTAYSRNSKSSFAH